MIEEWAWSVRVEVGTYEGTEGSIEIQTWLISCCAR